MKTGALTVCVLVSLGPSATAVAGALRAKTTIEYQWKGKAIPDSYSVLMESRLENNWYDGIVSVFGLLWKVGFAIKDFVTFSWEDLPDAVTSLTGDIGDLFSGIGGFIDNIKLIVESGKKIAGAVEAVKSVTVGAYENALKFANEAGGKATQETREIRLDHFDLYDRVTVSFEASADDPFQGIQSAVPTPPCGIKVTSNVGAQNGNVVVEIEPRKVFPGAYPILFTTKEGAMSIVHLIKLNVAKSCPFVASHQCSKDYKQFDELSLDLRFAERDLKVAKQDESKKRLSFYRIYLDARKTGLVNKVRQNCERKVTATNRGSRGESERGGQVVSAGANGARCEVEAVDPSGGRTPSQLRDLCPEVMWGIDDSVTCGRLRGLQGKLNSLERARRAVARRMIAAGCCHPVVNPGADEPTSCGAAADRRSKARLTQVESCGADSGRAKPAVTKPITTTMPVKTPATKNLKFRP